MSAFEFDEVSFGYGAEPVLRDARLASEPGELLAVIGPSGCGKTTMLRLLAGFERPRTGRITLGGEVMSDGSRFVPPARRRVGIVPQEGALFPHLRLADNVGFGLPRRAAGRADRIAELVALTGLEGLEDRYPRELSGGQQQRVALARALAPRPAVVLLDEPFASLDATTRTGVRRSVVDILRGERTTAVLVTHDREEALGLADRVAVLLDGGVAQVAPPEEVYDAPADQRVALLLGEATLLPVTGGALNGARFVGCALGELPLAASSLGRDEVLLRPEQLALDPEGVEGVVLVADFAGHSTRLLVELAGGVRVTAAVTRERPRAGERIRLAVRGPVHGLP